MARWFSRAVTSVDLDVTVQIEAAEGGRQWHVSWQVGEESISADQLLIQFDQGRAYQQLLASVSKKMQELANLVRVYELITDEWKTAQEILEETGWDHVGINWLRKLLHTLMYESDIQCEHSTERYAGSSSKHKFVTKCRRMKGGS